MIVYCSFMTEPEIDVRCQGHARWLVFYVVGSGRILTEPLPRCDTHLGPTVSVLAPGTYHSGWLHHVDQLVTVKEAAA